MRIKLGMRVSVFTVYSVRIKMNLQALRGIKLETYHFENSPNINSSKGS